jgi:hypothetical protein
MTCMHDLGTPESRHEAIEEGRRWLAECPPLPDAMTLARPIIDALTNLYEVFDGRADAMEFDYSFGEAYADDVDQLVTTAADVAAIVRATVDSFLTGDDRGTLASAGVDPVNRAITDTSNITHQRTMQRIHGPSGGQTD